MLNYDNEIRVQRESSVNRDLINNVLLNYDNKFECNDNLVFFEVELSMHALLN
jgi:hypothetical protein